MSTLFRNDIPKHFGELMARHRFERTGVIGKVQMLASQTDMETAVKSFLKENGAKKVFGIVLAR